MKRRRNGTMLQSGHAPRGVTRRELLRRTGTAAGAAVLSSSRGWFAGVLSPATARAASATAPRGGGTLKMGRPTDVANFDPFYVVEDNFSMERTLYDSLARYDPHGRLIPQLAESWEPSKDGLSLRVTLRNGAVFHSGREVRASDVAFSVRHAQEKRAGSQLRVLYNLVTDVETSDERTAVLRFRRPYPAMLDLLELTYVLDEQVATDLKAKPAGSGPFMVESWQPGNELVLKRNPHHWDAPRPYLDGVIQRAIPDAQSLVAALQAGDVDLIWNYPLPFYTQLKRDSRFRVDSGITGANYYDVTLNVTRAPLTNKLVRQAINHAIDRKQFVETVLYGAVTPTQVPFPSYSIAYFRELADRYPYDLDKAQALLAKAGVSSVSFSAVASAQVLPGFVPLAEIMQASLKKIGITMTIMNLEAARYWDLDHSSNFQMLMHNYGRANLDPDTTLGTTVAWRPGTNIGKFSDPKYAQLVTQAGSATNPTVRKTLYRKIVEIILDECWDLPIAAVPSPWAMAQRVKGFAYDRSGYAILAGTSLRG